jgi:HK97 gp10 family phage protein
MARRPVNTRDLGTVEGVDDFTGILDAMGDAAFGKVLHSATNAAMKPVLAAARANAKTFRRHEGDKGGHTISPRRGDGSYAKRLVQPGYAATQVRKRTNLSRDKQMASSIVTVTAKAHYAITYTERGHAKRGGGTVTAQPWLVPAMEGKKAEIIKIFGDKMSERIQHAIENPRPTRRRRR